MPKINCILLMMKEKDEQKTVEKGASESGLIRFAEFIKRRWKLLSLTVGLLATGGAATWFLLGKADETQKVKQEEEAERKKKRMDAYLRKKQAEINERKKQAKNNQ